MVQSYWLSGTPDGSCPVGPWIYASGAAGRGLPRGDSGPAASVAKAAQREGGEKPQLRHGPELSFQFTASLLAFCFVCLRSPPGLISLFALSARFER